MANEKKLQDRAQKTRSLIIESAFNCFKKYGYKKTNTILIAKNQNLSVGIVYTYFNSKDDLFELWLNSLLEKCDNYFYNQFKLLNYEVELSMIIGNILEKVSSSFFSSPVVSEPKSEYEDTILKSFYSKAFKVFQKCLYDSSIIIKNSPETNYIILQLLIDYNQFLKNKNLNLNLDILKDKYVKIIMSLITN